MSIAETSRPCDAVLSHGGLKTQLVGDCQTVISEAKVDQIRNAAGSIQWKFGVSNITKHFTANAKACGTVAAAPGFVSATSSHGKFVVITVG